MKQLHEYDTPETDAEHACFPMGGFTLDFARKLERERDKWKAKYIQLNKDIGCELRDPNGTHQTKESTIQAKPEGSRVMYFNGKTFEGVAA